MYILLLIELIATELSNVREVASAIPPSARERDVPRPHTRIGTGAQQLAVLLVALQPDDAVHPAGARVSDRDVRQRAGDAPDVDVRVQRP